MNRTKATSLGRLVHHPAAPGVLLMLAMTMALAVANSGVAWYGKLLDTPATIGIGEWLLQKPLLLWINVGLFALNRLGVKSAAPYLILGAALWIAVLKSGVHATLAGVALAAFIPSHRKNSDAKASLLHRMEHGLHPWVMFAILPVFAFANAGVPLAGLSPAALLEPVPLGIGLGLFIGKQLGVFSASWLAVKTGLARLPAGLNWAHVYGVSTLCGIGFTMSLFIGSLAFEATGGPDYAVDDRLGILAGSFLSASLGVIVLLFAHRSARAANRPRAASTEALDSSARVKPGRVLNNPAKLSVGS